MDFVFSSNRDGDRHLILSQLLFLAVEVIGLLLFFKLSSINFGDPRSIFCLLRTFSGICWVGIGGPLPPPLEFIDIRLAALP